MNANDINGLKQMDDAEYGDEAMPGGHVMVSAALAEQRQSKKRAQDDVKLLANRIALLKLEEKKVSSRFNLWILFLAGVNSAPILSASRGFHSRELKSRDSGCSPPLSILETPIVSSGLAIGG